MGNLTTSGEDIRTLAAIDDYIKENKFSPSVRDLADILDISSTSVVDHRLDLLKKNGWITKASFLARSIVITEEGRSVLDAA